MRAKATVYLQQTYTLVYLCVTALKYHDCLCCPWENHLHFLLLMVIFNHAQSFTAEAWKYFSLDIINFISHNDCIAKENTYQM